MRYYSLMLPDPHEKAEAGHARLEILVLLSFSSAEILGSLSWSVKI